jgi:DNA adenine methylase
MNEPVRKIEPKNFEVNTNTKPLLKWAGGKTQLLPQLHNRMPKKYGRYIEPFIGGGALFFSLEPNEGIIADSNPELINLYRAVADNVDSVISYLGKYKNDKDLFYEVRSQKWENMEPEHAAARTIFLNKTCFNGLYRVNKKGGFNVPFGKYKNPKILNIPVLKAASRLLQKTTIILGDYKQVLREHARKDDFIFLDPPYLPISEYSDFKRYTKEQFYEEDHEELAKEVYRLHKLGCHVLLTNSNHPLVHEQYKRFHIDVIQSKRHISSKAKSRKGEDVIVTIPPQKRLNLSLVPEPLPNQVSLYPSTRYMGSKNKLLDEIWNIASQFEFDTATDLFSGSGIVGYMFKSQGKQVLSNDYMAMSATFTKAMIENKNKRLSRKRAEKLLVPNKPSDQFVETTFQGLYFSDDDNRLIDTLRANIKAIRNPHERAIALAALIRTCLKKRPRGIFTYVGHRYDDGRKDLRTSFADHFLDAVEQINGAVFDNGKDNRSRQGDAMTFRTKPKKGLVYIDPPYYSPLSDNEYVRRYHFVEGIARDWKGVEIQEHTKTKKFKSYPTPFSSKKGAENAFDKLFSQYSDQIIIVSYSSNSLPTVDEMVDIMAKHKSHVEIVPVDYRYSFGNQGHKVGKNKNQVKEYLFVGY